MSHLPAGTPDTQSNEGKTLYASLVSNQDEASGGEENTSSLKHDVKNTSPRALNTSSQMVKSLSIDIISILVSIAVLTFASLGYSARGNVIGSRENKLLDTARIVATAFPFIFAFIIGRTLQVILSWRLEKGVDCLSFAYLSRGFTLGSTYTAPLRIRCAHWLPAVLIVMWAFSPLGSQGSLRFIFQQPGVVTAGLQDLVQYTYPMATFASACGNCQQDAHKSIFLASFFSISVNGRASQDSWGNLKIPLLASSGKIDADGWRQISPQTDQEYTALIGIPFKRPQSAGNMTFMMKSWYWQFENATLWEKGTEAPLLAAAPGSNDSLTLKGFTGTGEQWLLAIPKDLDVEVATSIPITFAVTPSGANIRDTGNVTYSYGSEADINSAVRLDGVLTQRPVELNVTCTVSSCNVTAIRNTTFDADYVVVSDMTQFCDFTLPYVAEAFPIEHLGTSMYGMLEAYLYDPSQNPYSVLNNLGYNFDLSTVSAQALAQRLGQVLNTYWIVDNQFQNAAGGFNASDPTLVRVTGNVSSSAVMNSNATAVSAEQFLRCSPAWMALLSISTLIMLVAAIAAAVLNFVRLAPDSTSFLSALTLNDGKSLFDGGSYLDEDERTRLLKDVRLKIGDVRAYEDIGQIAIGEENTVGDLEKGRLYL